MKLITHKTNRDSHWARIDLTCVEDPRLSPLAKCLHIYAMTRPPDWELRTEDLVRRLRVSERSVQRGMKELQRAGYLVRRQENIHGQFQTHELSIYDEPQSVQYLDPEPVAKSRPPGNRQADSRESVDGMHTNNQDTNHQENKKHERESVEGYSAEFKEFLSVYPVKHDKFTAWQRWNERLNEGMQPEDMILAARHYRDYQKAIGTTRRYLMAAYTFLGSKAKVMDWMEERKVDDDGRHEHRKTGGRVNVEGQTSERCAAARRVSDTDRELYRQVVLRQIGG